MRVAVFGVSGGISRAVVDPLLAGGHETEGTTDVESHRREK
jgi:nucleoside-diphosphate-sugar epimerase